MKFSASPIVIPANAGIQLFLCSRTASRILKRGQDMDGSMNAQANILICDDTAHIFRSKFIDIFSDLEAWALDMWQCLYAKPTAKKKIPPHFGNRIKNIQEKLEAESGLFRSPDELMAILKELAPYSRIRATLMHGRLRQARIVGGETLYLVENVLGQEEPAFARRVALRARELETMLNELTALVPQLRMVGKLI